jgi:ribosome biogenesis GTPase
VGDWVVLTHPAEHEHAVITRLLPRRTALVRRDPGAADAAQVVVSNIERIFVVAALTADAESLNLARLERGMVIAADSGADVTVVLTKADLCADADVAARRARSVAAGYEVIIESAIDGRGIAEVARLMPPGQTTALIGASGTGKSTLINRLLGHERQAVGLVRERDDKGRHTTVAREMVALPNGGVVIDTPGIRSVALWQARRGLALVFPEIEEAACTCKFSDCTHTREPGCAVAAAVAAGAIDPSRLERYRILSDEITTSAHRQR